MKRLGNKGNTLISTVIGAAIVLLAIVAASQLFARYVKNQGRINFLQTSFYFRTTLGELLSESQSCAVNFAGINLSSYTPQRTTIVDRDGNPLYLVGSVYEDEQLVLQEIQLANFQTRGGATSEGIVDLVLVLEQTGTGHRLGKVIPLAVSVVGGAIGSCVAVSNSINQPWVSNPNGGHLVFQGHSLGIGDFTHPSAVSSPPLAEKLVVVKSGPIATDDQAPNNAKVAANAFYKTSDSRLKRNIGLAGGLSIISKLNGYRYFFKSAHEGSLGLLAQEVEQVMPGSVVTDETTGYKSVSYSQVLSPLVEANKELYSQSTNNKKKFQKTERDLDDLLKAIGRNSDESN